MRLIEAEVEKTRMSSYKNLKDELTVFMRMNVKSAKVLFTKDEYSCSTAVRVSLGQAAKRMGLPIKAKSVNENVYLIRTDF